MEVLNDQNILVTDTWIRQINTIITLEDGYTTED